MGGLGGGVRRGGIRKSPVRVTMVEGIRISKWIEENRELIERENWSRPITCQKIQEALGIKVQEGTVKSIFEELGIKTTALSTSFTHVAKIADLTEQCESHSTKLDDLGEKVAELVGRIGMDEMRFAELERAQAASVPKFRDLEEQIRGISKRLESAEKLYVKASSIESSVTTLSRKLSDAEAKIASMSKMSQDLLNLQRELTAFKAEFGRERVDVALHKAIQSANTAKH